MNSKNAKKHAKKNVKIEEDRFVTVVTQLEKFEFKKVKRIWESSKPKAVNLDFDAKSNLVEMTLSEKSQLLKTRDSEDKTKFDEKSLGYIV